MWHFKKKTEPNRTKHEFDLNRSRRTELCAATAILIIEKKQNQTSPKNRTNQKQKKNHRKHRNRVLISAASLLQKSSFNKKASKVFIAIISIIFNIHLSIKQTSQSTPNIRNTASQQGQNLRKYPYSNPRPNHKGKLQSHSEKPLRTLCSHTSTHFKLLKSELITTFGVSQKAVVKRSSHSQKETKTVSKWQQRILTKNTKPCLQKASHYDFGRPSNRHAPWPFPSTCQSQNHHRRTIRDGNRHCVTQP
jgi:hypothetical protein